MVGKKWSKDRAEHGQGPQSREHSALEKARGAYNRGFDLGREVRESFSGEVIVERKCEG